MARLTVHDDGTLDVVLSQRNLLALLVKLQTPGSACELQAGDVPDGFRKLRLRAESDETHYASSSRLGAAAGSLHPHTQAIIDAITQAVDNPS